MKVIINKVIRIDFSIPENSVCIGVTFLVWCFNLIKEFE